MIDEQVQQDDYGAITPLDWARYEFATIEYDHKISPEAARAIDAIFQRLYDEIP